MRSANYALNGLRTFEAAARHATLSSCAEELHITQAAVSQQIRRLESQLGFKLFDRSASGLILTAAGKELAIATSIALRGINISLDKILSRQDYSVLTISTLASFASKWLTSRIPAFNAKHPTTELYIHTSSNKIDLQNGRIDGAIRLCENADDSLHTIPLFQDYLCLVALPGIAREIGGDVSKLYDYPLIVDGTQNANRSIGDFTSIASDRVISQIGLCKDKLDLIVHSQSDNVVQAALAGQGIALTRFSLCMDDLVLGKIDIAFQNSFPLNFGYSFVCPKELAMDMRVIIFTKWLQEELAVSPFYLLNDENTRLSTNPRSLNKHRQFYRSRKSFSV